MGDLQGTLELELQRLPSTLTSTSEESFYDPNLDAHSAFASSYGEEESPYPEVRSAVANTDDPSMPCSTMCVIVLISLRIYVG